MMALYSPRQLAAGMRAVRANTILMAGDIPAERYDYRATPGTRSIGETLVHIAWLWTSDRILHDEAHISTAVGYDFASHMAQSTVEERRPRSKQEIVELLKVEGERQAAWVESKSDAFLAERVAMPEGSSVSRFEWILASKEHEIHHRAQLTVLDRLIGVVPRFTGLA